MQNIYTVAQINAYIKNMFMQDYLLQSVSVQGEVSNCKYHSSGHIYFTLKDKKGTLSCVMFAGNRRGLDFTMTEGMQVIVEGSVDIYERDGKYQLYARKIKKDGAGALFEQFERLKQELLERGLFAKEYKQSIPKYICTLGVVTASTGAAIRDIINITKRRNPYVQIVLYPAIVQGDAAPASIVQGIRALEQLGVDVMIVGRGGGSLEDLWAFNTEIVAQAVFDCHVPIISAVGHETDTTIIDFVSDLRAPTPSAAAELAVYDVSFTLEQIRECSGRLDDNMKRKVHMAKIQTIQKNQLLQSLSPMAKIREKKFQCLRSEEVLRELMAQKLNERKHGLQIQIERLQGLSPLQKLQQGYSYMVNDNNKNIRSIEQVEREEILQIYVTDGKIHARVENVETIERIP
ncbi:MAG: exodeoxyribonuclease VII large subunit [Lachnospiraceae bacterium]|nr:exodeoxyribonuclease VII large subunit [Lachnospiraceae bacterium]